MARAASTTFDIRCTGRRGNCVAQRRSGMRHHLRASPRRYRQPTAAQVTQRQIFGELRRHWRDTLSQSQRNGWDTWAALTETLPARYTGQLAYVTTNSLRAICKTDPEGRTLNPVRIDDPPTYYHLGQTSGNDLHPFAVTITPGEGTAEVNYDHFNPWATDRDHGALIMYQSPSLPMTHRSQRHGYRFAGCVVGPNFSGRLIGPRPFFLAAPLKPNQHMRFRVRSVIGDGRFTMGIAIPTIIAP